MSDPMMTPPAPQWMRSRVQAVPLGAPVWPEARQPYMDFAHAPAVAQTQLRLALNEVPLEEPLAMPPLASDVLLSESRALFEGFKALTTLHRQEVLQLIAADEDDKLVHETVYQHFKRRNRLLRDENRVLWLMLALILAAFVVGCYRM